MIYDTKIHLKDLQKTTKLCINIVEQYKWLIDSYVLDFFVDEHWSKLPSSWKSFLDRATPDDLAFLIDLQNDEIAHSITHVWPLEILALKASIKTYSLKRNPIGRLELCKNLGLVQKLEDEIFQEWPSNCTDELTTEGGQHKGLKHVFRKHIKPKKQHEIVRMSQLALMLANKTKEQNKIDIGAGLGHLSRLLSFGHDFNVVCLEAEDQFGSTAIQFDQDLIKASTKANPCSDATSKSPKHVTLNVDPRLDSKIFEVKTDEIFLNKIFGLVGLHTCGDLGPTIIRLYAETAKASSLQSVGCCYMHLKEAFPLSQVIKSVSNSLQLSYVALELACHAIETYKDRLKALDEREKLKVHCRRALLELLLQNKRPDLRHKGLKTVKNSHLMPFKEYVTKATHGLDVNFNEEELENDVMKVKQDQWWRVVAFYTLRLLFAPLIETLVLLDRCLYLHDKGFPCSLAPLFDPKLSPRNFVIYSVKK